MSEAFALLTFGASPGGLLPAVAGSTFQSLWRDSELPDLRFGLHGVGRTTPPAWSAAVGARCRARIISRKPRRNATPAELFRRSYSPTADGATQRERCIALQHYPGCIRDNRGSDAFLHHAPPNSARLI